MIIQFLDLLDETMDEFGNPRSGGKRCR